MVNEKKSINVNHCFLMEFIFNGIKMGSTFG